MDSLTIRWVTGITKTRRGDLLFHRPHERHSILTEPGQPYVCISLVFHFGTSPFPYEDLFQGKHLLGNFADHPVDALLSQRVNKAKELAIQSSLSIGEIATRVGHADVHTFGRMFKKKTGQSLSQGGKESI
jgi:AraC-like DNA-binding protein